MNSSQDAKSKLDNEKHKIEQSFEESKDKVEEFYHHTKDKAGELYEEGKRKVCDAQHNLKECSDEIVKYVKEKPLTSLLIAGGVGFILSALLKK